MGEVQGQSKVYSLNALYELADDDSSKLDYLVKMGIILGKQAPLEAIDTLKIALQIIDESEQLNKNQKLNFKHSAWNNLSTAYS